jgi:hypothetical protein
VIQKPIHMHVKNYFDILNSVIYRLYCTGTEFVTWYVRVRSRTSSLKQFKLNFSQTVLSVFVKQKQDEVCTRVPLGLQFLTGLSSEQWLIMVSMIHVKVWICHTGSWVGWMVVQIHMMILFCIILLHNIFFPTSSGHPYQTESWIKSFSLPLCSCFTFFYKFT